MKQVVYIRMTCFIFYSSAWRYEGGRVILDDKRMHTVPWIVVFGKTELIFVQILW